MKLNKGILNDYFQSGIVFPKNKEFKIGGIVKPCQKVSISFLGIENSVISDKKGNWSYTFSPISSLSLNEKLIVYTEKQKQEISHLHLGKVYLLSGQSNIEYRLKDDAEYQEVLDKIKLHHYPNLYYYNVPQVDFIQEDGNCLPKNLRLEKWHHINQDNVGQISAVGFYMMQKLAETDAEPIAIVDCFKGGTSASVWISKENLVRDPELNVAFIKPYQQAIANKTNADFNKETELYNQKVKKHNYDLKKYLDLHPDTSLSAAKNIVGHTPWPPPMRPELFTRPSGLYTTMLKQVKNGSFNGMVWYQGENDTDRWQHYDKLLPLLLETWRKKLKDPSLPIKIIQLPGYADYPNNSGAEIRNIQAKVSQNIPNTDLVSFVDGGEKHNIHPTHKKKMGNRLGEIISRNNYAGTPIIILDKSKSDKIRLIASRSQRLKLDNRTIFTVKFKDDKEKQLEISPKDIYKNIIELKLDPTKIKYISYGFENYPQNIGLYNELDYPVSPFKIIF